MSSRLHLGSRRNLEVQLKSRGPLAVPVPVRAPPARVPINCVFFALLHERSEQVLEAVDNVAFHFLRKGNVLVRHDGPKWYLTKQVFFDFFCKSISQFHTFLCISKMM